MKEPMRTLFLNGCKMTGKMEEAVYVMEESLTVAELKALADFVAWLKDHGLTVGHGTIDLRWDECQSKREPMTREAAYQWAMQQIGQAGGVR